MKLELEPLTDVPGLMCCQIAGDTALQQSLGIAAITKGGGIAADFLYRFSPHQASLHRIDSADDFALVVGPLRAHRNAQLCAYHDSF